VTLTIRRGTTFDAREMAALLNEIIERGGTTARVLPTSPEYMADWIGTPGTVWHVAEDQKGKLLGFQHFETHPDLPDGVVDIATFVRVGQTGFGIGSALFSASCDSAREMGFVAIDAVIRADNAGGLAYYQSRGFETINIIKNACLDDGTIVDKIWKRFDLLA